jgi:hypothetical protein
MDTTAKKVTRYSLRIFVICSLLFLMFGTPFMLHDWTITIIFGSVGFLFMVIFGIQRLIDWAWNHED